MRANRGLAKARGLVRVQVITADLAKEDLPFHTKTAVRASALASFDQASHHFELRA